ncbi:hypothetical protein Taro_001157 [Colocasia esculenta]|uniref:Uncharacterized protein n=1 Tax=Colocasia esculenta TaxID=4460 RepID=A0A843TF38_COLES|nr:hypothetical protein [Colocasia esculenta]
MIERGSRGGDVTAGAPDNSRDDVRATSDSEMMWHKEVHVGKRSHVARHVRSGARNQRHTLAKRASTEFIGLVISAHSSTRNTSVVTSVSRPMLQLP